MNLEADLEFTKWLQPYKARGPDSDQTPARRTVAGPLRERAEAHLQYEKHTGLRIRRRELAEEVVQRLHGRVLRRVFVRDARRQAGDPGVVVRTGKKGDGQARLRRRL